MNEVGFQHFARHDGEFVAVVDPRGRRWSRRELCDLVNRTARAFVAAGLHAGDAVAIVAPNCAEYLAVHLAAIEAGLLVVPVNWHLADDELAFVLEDSEARAVIAHERLGAARIAALLVRGSRARIFVSIGRAPGFTPLHAFVNAQPPDSLATRAPGRVMAYTSATTGRPKAVLLPLRNALPALQKTIEWHVSLGIEPENDNVHLCASMLYHSAPLDGAVTALHMGHRVVLADRWTPEMLLQLIERHRVTTSFMVPTMFVRLLKLPEDARRRFASRSLRFVIHSGAPCPIDVKRTMIEWWGPIIWESYGAAEVQGTVVSPEEWLARPGTVGRPIAGSQLKILDDEGRKLPPGEVGLIYMTPHTGDRFQYKGDPDKTRSSRRGEFVTVGDIGYVDEAGYLFVCDRSAELIVSSGMNIYPAEIEQVLVQHPAVTDCAIYGVPHELFGHVPRALVQPRRGAEAGPKLTSELLQFLATRLSAMKLPRRVDYTARIPRDPNGKLHRRLLPGAASSSDATNCHPGGHGSAS